jgi:deoxyribonuclease (pyrimidine dimer)
MTRVNLVPPAELFDQHLLAEYRELLMIPAALRRTLQSRKGLVQAACPKRFTLNTGHVSFFYNKGKYLDRRYAALRRELRQRGFKLDPGRVFPAAVFIDNGLYGDWRPDAAALALIRARLSEKLALRPGWYRKTPRN